ncbi:YciI family protein [Fibrobacterota bacterium]
MPKRYVYVYFMKDKPEVIKDVVSSHSNYWKTCSLENYLGGPFADRSGGIISFSSESLEQAGQVIEKDPFTTNNVIETRWIKEWIPE